MSDSLGPCMAMEKVKNVLRPFFKWKGKGPWYVTLIRPFILGIPLIAAMGLGVDKVVLPNLPGRELTTGEVGMLKPIFKDSVDYSKVRIHHSKVGDLVRFVFRATAVTRSSTIIENNDTPDYSAKTVDFVTKYQFTHEMTHVWQNQNNVSDSFFRVGHRAVSRVNLADNQFGLYSYRLKGAADLTDFNVEAQAGIVPDYFMIVENERATQKNIPSPLLADGSKDPAERKVAYERVLKQFLADPSYPRKK